MKRIILTLICSLGTMIFVHGQEQQAEQMLSEAIYQEEVNGQLDEAIEAYQKIVTEFPEHKPVAAKAQFHIGLCYEKLGLKEAQIAYRKVLDNYPGQEQEIALAKERLNRLLALQDVLFKPTFRKSPIPTELSGNLALSPDGQKLLLVSDEKLWIMPLSGNLGSDFPGKPIQLNTDGVKVSWAGFSWSGDGKSIAFNEIRYDTPEEGNKIVNIYTLSAESGKLKKIFENNCSGLARNYRTSLSPDGKNLAFSSVDGGKQHIYTISANGGVPQKMVDALSREPVFSPDGKMIAYVEDERLGGGGGNLWVMPASGGPSTLIAQAGNAGSPVWSPEASRIAFLDYFEDGKIYIVPVGKDGNPDGEKITINAPVETSNVLQLTGWSADNKIGALMDGKLEYGLYTLPEQGGQAALVVHGGWPYQPRWSPDGKQILFLNVGERKGGWPNSKIAIVSAEGGEETNILSVSDNKIGLLPFQTGIRVSPNGKEIVISAGKHEDPALINNHPTLQIWKTSTEGGNLTQITKPPLPYTDYSPCWSPDGKSIAFIRSTLIEEAKLYGETGIYTINSSGGEPKLLISESDAICSINWSPDGKYIAYLGNSLCVVNVNNGASKVVGEVPRWNVHTELAWSPDSKRIAFNDREGKVIKVLSVDDGQVQDIETGLVNSNIFHLDWSPDGKRFVFAGSKGGEPEFWWLENFLPVSK